MFRVFCLLLGYAIGCIQNAYIVGKTMSKIDIREHGSGNAGTTNVIRTLGIKAGMAVFALDILKGLIGFVVGTIIFDGDSAITNGSNDILPGLYAGLGVILGHDFPFYLGFRGGKGTASTCGAILFVDFRIALIDYISTMFLIGFTKYVSLGSLWLTAILPVLLYVFKYSKESILVSIVIAIISYYQHRENIKRLLAGNENKFTLKRRN